MRLSPEDVEMFYKLYFPLLIYVNKKFNILRGLNSSDDFKNFPPEEINKIRDRLYKNPHLFDSFIMENPYNLSTDELKIISTWKNFVKGKFLIFRYLKNYTIFLDVEEPPKAYGVLALTTTFQEMIGPNLPIMVEAVLLPFKDKIIYDSIFIPYSITFGSNIRSDFNDAYQRAKLSFGIITSFPPPSEKKESNEDKLRFYLSNKRNREIYWEEIEDLINKDPKLLILYHQEMGKIHARKYRKRLREIGLIKGWFAIFEGIIIASGTTREEVEQTLQHLLASEKRKFVYLFQLK